METQFKQSVPVPLGVSVEPRDFNELGFTVNQIADVVGEIADLLRDYSELPVEQPDGSQVLVLQKPLITADSGSGQVLTHTEFTEMSGTGGGGGSSGCVQITTTQYRLPQNIALTQVSQQTESVKKC